MDRFRSRIWANFVPGEKRQAKSLSMCMYPAIWMVANSSRLKRFLIRTRNEKVTAPLQQHYQEYPAASNLRTFCVSNTMYWEHRNESSDVSLPFLELSNIIALRKHCLEIVAESNLR